MAKGRKVPETSAPEAPREIMCYACEAPAGEVQLVKTSSGQYHCMGGCHSQREIAFRRWARKRVR
jgi:uncharacterized ParB-like nuclease family protein